VNGIDEINSISFGQNVQYCCGIHHKGMCIKGIIDIGQYKLQALVHVAGYNKSTCCLQVPHISVYWEILTKVCLREQIVALGIEYDSQKMLDMKAKQKETKSLIKGPIHEQRQAKSNHPTKQMKKQHSFINSEEFRQKGQRSSRMTVRAR
jgi:hypothetical protein